MADLSQSDVQRAVRDELSEIKKEIYRIRDDVQKIEQRTNDLDRSQEEIKRLFEFMPKLETLSRQMVEVHDDADKIDRVISHVDELRAPLLHTSQYLQQVAAYLNALDGRLRQKFGDDDDGFRNI